MATANANTEIMDKLSMMVTTIFEETKNPSDENVLMAAKRADGYKELLFTFGGPTISAIKTKKDKHFVLNAHWQDDSMKVVDEDDVFERAYGHLFN